MHRGASILAISIAFLVVVLAACGGADPQPAAPAGGTAGAPRDLSSFDVCSRLPIAEVARILGSDPARISGEATSSRYASDCTYTVNKGDGFNEYSIVWVYPTEMWDPPLDAGTEKLTGLGDEAYAMRMAQFHQVHVLIRGDLFLDVRTNSPLQARQLAQLAVEHLAGASG